MQNILVCQTGGWIGDMVLLTPALRALKRAYPRSELKLLLRQRVSDLMRTHPYVDACIVDNKTEGGYRAFMDLVRQIRSNPFDLAVVLHPTSFRNALLPWLAGVPVRVGTNVGGRGVLLTASCPDNTGCHEVHRYLRVLKLLHIDAAPSFLEFWHTDADRGFIERLLESEGVLPDARIIVLNLGTTWKTKRWDVTNFADLCEQIVCLAPGVKVVLTGAPEDQALADALPVSSSIVNLVGKTGILQLGALLERCEVCLTCDSGPMHIAAAVGTPTVALFGPTSPRRHRPYGTGHTVIEKPVSCRPCYKQMCHRQDARYLCMNEISTVEVVNALAGKLRQKACGA